MPVDWSPLVDLVRHHQRFLLTTHIRPDGDGLGSMLALADALASQSRTAELVVASGIPPRYNFLDPSGKVKRFTDPTPSQRAAEVILVLDTGTWNQLGDFGPFL